MNQTAKTIDADVLIIGSGVAGLQAALTASKSGQKAVLVSKSPVGKANNTTLAGGGFSFSTDALSVDEHIEKTMESGRFLNDRKLVEFFETGRNELYNLKDDIGEKHDVAAANVDKVAELHAKMLAWREKVGAKMPTKNVDESDAKKLTKKERRQRKKARQAAGEED